MSNPVVSAKTIPQHVFERHENEWRQMQTNREAAPKPAPQPGQN
jgi:hypothetical protein